MQNTGVPGRVREAGGERSAVGADFLLDTGSSLELVYFGILASSRFSVLGNGGELEWSRCVLVSWNGVGVFWYFGEWNGVGVFWSFGELEWSRRVLVFW